MTAAVVPPPPLACAESSVGSTQVGFVMALVGVPVKELLDDVGYWRRTRVLMVREVSSRLLLLGSTRRTKDRPTPPILASRQKEKKKDQVEFQD